MFISRYISRTKIICVFSCKYSSNEKSNTIKQLNTENKYLYGSLLETKTQRRKLKATGKVVNEKSRIENSLEVGLSTSNEHEDHKPKINQKRSRKSKSTGLSSSESSSPHLNVLNSDVATETRPIPLHKSGENSPNDKIANKRTSQSKISDIGLPKLHRPDEFVFKSLVLINERNYPLENVDKNASQNSSTKTVLNYSFTDSAVTPYSKFPSVSKIMEDTMSDKNKFILSKWRQNMIRDLGEEGFSKHCEDLKSRGHDFHSAVSDTVLGKPTKECSEVTLNALKSLEWMLEHVSNPLAVESITAHPLLEYKGIPDCVLHFRGIPVVVDWKLSDKPKKDLKDTYEAPVQITAYIGALNHDPNYKWVVNHGLVAVAYTSGAPCDVFLLAPKHCEIYWRHWLVRCDKFKAHSHLHTDHVIDEQTLL